MTKYKWNWPLIAVTLLTVAILSVLYFVLGLGDIDLQAVTLFTLDDNSIILNVWQDFVIIAQAVFICVMVIFLGRELHKHMSQNKPDENISAEEIKSYYDKDMARINRIQSSPEFMERMERELNKITAPSFDDLKKLIEETAKQRKDTVEHIIIEAYSAMLAMKITFEMDKGIK